MDKFCAHCFGGLCKIARAIGIYGKGFLAMFIALYGGGVACGVDDGIWLETLHHVQHGIVIGDVEGFGVGGDEFPVFG